MAAVKRQTLEKNKEDVSHLHNRLYETIQAVDYVAQNGDDIAILSVRKGMAHHMSTLLKLKCQVPNPSHRTQIDVSLAACNIENVLEIGAHCNCIRAGLSNRWPQDRMWPSLHLRGSKA